MLDNNPRGSPGDNSTHGSQQLNVNTSKYETGGHPYNKDGAGIAENKGSNINTSFVLGHTVVIAMGFAQFGK